MEEIQNMAFLNAVIEGDKKHVQVYVHAYKFCDEVKLAAFQIAAGKGYTPIVQFLAEIGFTNAHAEDELALRLAVWFGRTETVQYLLSLGADIEAGAPSALECAVHRRQKELMELLSPRAT